MHSRATLAAGFRDLGVVPGDVVMLHASIRAIGPVAGGPDQIHLALKDALGEGGTLLMYASCPQHYDEIGRGNLTADEEREILETLPAFDARTARSQRENGALVELFRTWPGSTVNDHVARFVVWGARAAELFAEQPWSYALGRRSALERFAALGGRILLLGCDHDNVTFLHYAEHIVEIPDKIVARFKVPVLEKGVRVWREMEEFDTAHKAHASWPDRFFAVIVDDYIARFGAPRGKVGGADAVLMDASGLLQHALALMQEAASS